MVGNHLCCPIAFTLQLRFPEVLCWLFSHPSIFPPNLSSDYIKRYLFSRKTNHSNFIQTWTEAAKLGAIQFEEVEDQMLFVQACESVPKLTHILHYFNQTDFGKLSLEFQSKLLQRVAKFAS